MSEETQRINLDDYIQTGEGGTAGHLYKRVD